MYPIKFLADLVNSGIGDLVKDPFDPKIHPTLEHDLGDMYKQELFKKRNKSSKFHESVVVKIIDLIEKEENKSDLSQGKSNVYFDVYFYLIKTKLKASKNMDELMEEDLPGALRHIQNVIDFKAPDHILMYTDMISMLPKTQFLKSRLVMAEKIFDKASVKCKNSHIGEFIFESKASKSSVTKKLL
jgi:hypothetical protein